MIRLAFAFLLSLCVSAQAQLNGGGTGFPGPGIPAAASFTGIGDVKSGAFAAFSASRAYSAATRGNRLMNVCDSTGGTDVACADMLSDASTGLLVSQTIGGITCPGDINCKVKTFYDLTVGSACSGSPCDLTQSTVASRATLNSTLGSRNCAGTAGNYSIATLSAQAAGTFSLSAVVQASATTGTRRVTGTSGTSGIGLGINSGNWQVFSPNNQGATAADTNAHAFQVTGGASGFIRIDNSSTNVNPGSTVPSGTLALFRDTFANAWTGILCEVTWYPNGAVWNSTDAANAYTNQSAFYNGAF